jgi:NhaP-type Na+/H+ and K+/H+ antiporter
LAQDFISEGAMVAGIIREETIIIPGGESVIEPDDRIIIFATREAIPASRKFWLLSWSIFNALALHSERCRGVDPVFRRDHGGAADLPFFHGRR